jgi:glucan biosynthesis protein C
MGHTTAVDSTGASDHRLGHIDNLKVALVTAVIVGHTTIAWTGVGTWVFEEPHVRDPLFSILTLSLVGALLGMAIFFFIAGMFTAPSLARKGPRRFLADRAIRLGVPMLFFIIFMSPIIEYVDPDNAYWDKGFWAFTLKIWWPQHPGRPGSLEFCSCSLSFMESPVPLGRKSRSRPYA